MTDNDIQREIEENQRRARDEEDVGLEEDVLLDREDGRTILDDIGEALLGKKDSREREVEYNKDEDDGKSLPE